MNLTIKYWPTEKLLPYAKNARLHSEEQVGQIARSIEAFGFVNPVLIDHAGEIVAGHGRALAAKALGLKRVPVIQLGHLTPEQIRAYRIADNRLAETGGGWNYDLVKLEMGELSALGFDLSLTGFDLGDLGETKRKLGSLSELFGVPPFSVLSARDGWWQDRKRGWLALGIQSELGRGENANDRSQSGSARINDARDMQGRKANDLSKSGAVMPIGGGLGDNLVTVRAKQKRERATPGGSKMPAADYSKRQRGDGRGRPV